LIQIPGVDHQRLLTNSVRAIAKSKPHVGIVEIVGGADADKVDRMTVLATVLLVEESSKRSISGKYRMS
jgi:hypothetical protein